MPLCESVYSVLIVSCGEKFSQSLISLLPESRFDPVHTVASAASAKRALLGRSYDFVIVNAPLSDDFGTDLALDVCRGDSSVALLLVKNDLFDDIAGRVGPFGVYTLSKPTSNAAVNMAISWMCATRERLRRMQKRAASAEEKIEEIRLVNRAKWLLISELKMTETDAHRYIEKQAMDRCVSKRDIAADIIRNYS